MTARMSVRRLPPPGLVGGIKGSTYAHSSSVKSLGYLRWSRSYFARFSSVHIDGPPANQTTSFESYMIQSTQEVSKRTLTVRSDQPVAHGHAAHAGRDSPAEHERTREHDRGFCSGERGDPEQGGLQPGYAQVV